MHSERWKLRNMRWLGKSGLKIFIGSSGFFFMTRLRACTAARYRATDFRMARTTIIFDEFSLLCLLLGDPFRRIHVHPADITLAKLDFSALDFYEARALSPTFYDKNQLNLVLLAGYCSQSIS